MPMRITRRSLIGWFVRSAPAAAALGLLPGNVKAAPGEAPPPSPLPIAMGRGLHRQDSSLHHSGEGSGVGPLPVSVRMADLVLEGRDLRAGIADGIRLPSQGGDAWSLTAERPGGAYTSPPLQAAFPSTHVGIHWRTDGGDQSGLRVELRASRDGQTWMPWKRVTPESHGPDRLNGQPGTETFGALVSARLGTWLQARVTFGQAGPETAAIDALTLTCLDSRRSDLSSPPWGPSIPTAPPAPLSGAERGATEAGAMNRAPTTLQPVGARFIAPDGFARNRPAPSGLTADRLALDRGEVNLKAGPSSFLDRVVSREAWGADESLRFKDGVDQWPAAFVTPSLLVVHHTASDGDLSDAEADVRAIYAYHAVTQGWGDVGYNLLIDSSGRVYEGRRGREPDASGKRELVSEGVVAGHALDYNYGSVGIALIGNFQERTPGHPMLDALVDALAFMAERYGIDVAATQDYVRVRSDQTALWRDGMQNVSGHRDCLPTECPGDNVYGLLPEIRQRVDEQLGLKAASVQIETAQPLDRNLWPTDLPLIWQGDASVASYRTRLAAWRRIPGTDRIEPLSGYDADLRPVWGDWIRDTALAVPLPPDAKGIYTLFVQGRDAAGREGRVVARRSFVVDRHVIVDDTDALRTRHEGAWERNRGILGYYGSGYQQAEPGQNAASYRWQLSVPEPGAYAVQAAWTEAPNRTAQATYRVSQGGTTLATAIANQQDPGGKWTKVLEVPLTAGVPCTVELEGAADGLVVADAIRLVLLP